MLHTYIIIKYGIVGIDKKCMECIIFACLETHLTIGFSQKTDLNALVNKIKSRLFRSTYIILNFKKIENHMDFICQPASLPACYKTRLC